MSSEDTKRKEELAREAMEADDGGAVEKEIEKGTTDPEEAGGKAGDEDSYGERNASERDSAEKADGAAASEDGKSGSAHKEGSAGAQSNPSGEKKGFFGKKKDKKDARDDKIEELTDRLQRNMAEFDNFRKRTEKEKAAMFEIGAKDIIEKILPVVDNFERGLATIPEEDKGTPFADGMEKIYKQLMKTLEDAGVRPIEAVGQPFDPNFHNAVMHIEDESLGENVVAQELQKGYLYRDSVVRHSMVQVAN